MDDAGVPTYDELVLVANADALERDGGTIRAFIGALSRGVRDLREDPDGALDGLLEANPRPRPGAPARGAEGHPPAVLAAARQAVRLAGPASSGTRSGPGCEDNRLLEGPPDARGAFTNELLPGAGL